jgi:hypothetical protein
MSPAHATCPIDDPADAEESVPRALRRPRVGRPPIEESIEFVMPVQFHTPASQAWWPGEKRLMLALLTDAIHILMKGPGVNHPRQTTVFEETVAWFTRDDADWPCSFVNVCDALGIDARAVRDAIRRRMLRRPPSI